MKRFSALSTGFSFAVLLVVANAYGDVTHLHLGVWKATDPVSFPTIPVKYVNVSEVGSGYQKYELSFDLSSGNYVRLELGMGNDSIAPGYVLLDKITLTGPSGAVVMTNPGFESGTSGWGAGGTSGTIYTFTADSDAYEGSKAGKITVTSAGYCQIGNQITIGITESGVFTLSVYAKVTDEVLPPKEIFGMAVGNTRIYQGTCQGEPYASEVNIVSMDMGTFPFITTYVAELMEDWALVGRTWYEVRLGKLRLWGMESEGQFLKFSNGLIAAWYPLKAGDHRYSEASLEIYGVSLKASLTVDVLAAEEIALDFDTFESFRTHYQLRIWSLNPAFPYDRTQVWDYWLVPYLGPVKYQDDECTEILTSFAIWGGEITEETDADEEGLKDYEELILYGTDWQEPDTDDDGFDDYTEVQEGYDPLDPGSHPLFCLGDFDEDKDIDGADLWTLALNPGLLDLPALAVNFGKAQCSM